MPVFILISSGKLAHIATTVIRPHYQRKIEVLENTLDAAMPDIPWYLHQGEGAIFAWLWLKDLPMTDWEFYQELKQVGVSTWKWFLPWINRRLAT